MNTQENDNLKAEATRLQALPMINGKQYTRLQAIRAELDARNRRHQAAKLAAAWNAYFYD